MARSNRRTTAGRSSSAGQHQFSQIPSANIQRSTFNRSCNMKTTLDAGNLVPIFLDEALPGDTMNLSMSTFCRMATPKYPVMDNMFMDFFFFAVPNRLLWDNWEKFNGAQDAPGDSTDFLVPTITAPSGGYTEESLSDYFGIPTKVENITHSALWHRAYNLIFNEWFRDENLIDPQPHITGNGPDDPANYKVMRRGKRHDYFSSALPWPQKGPAVPLPLTGTAPVSGSIVGLGDNRPIFDASGSANGPLQAKTAGGGTDFDVQLQGSAPIGSDEYLTWNQPKLQLQDGEADLSQATAATINELRESFQIQRMFERDARGGTRYTEILRSHFGVVSPDARLQRPEYLGGGTATINVSPISNTAGISASVGDLGAFVTSSSTGTGFNKSFTEHCVIIGLVCVRADLNYQQGLDRMFQRSTRYDFYWPSLAHLGEQAIKSSEIYADGTAADDDTFGYQERFAEYRYKPSKITGQFRSNAATPLDSWHLAQDFEDRPLLNQSFIEENPPVDRVITVPSEPQFLFDASFQYKCARPMPVYSVPGLIDHF